MSDNSTPQDAELSKVQEIRFKLIDALTNGGTPSDKDEQLVLLTALRDAGKQAVDIKKIGIESKALDMSAQAREIMAAILRESNNFKHPNGVPKENHVAPTLDPSVPNAEVIAGELEINPPQTNFNQFTGR